MSQKRRNLPQWEVAHKKKRKVFGPVTNKDRVKYKKTKTKKKHVQFHNVINLITQLFLTVIKNYIIFDRF